MPAEMTLPGSPSIAGPENVIGPAADVAEARDAIEQGGLAGAVRADQAADLAAPQLQRDAVQGANAAEANRDVFNVQNGGSARPAPC